MTPNNPTEQREKIADACEVMATRLLEASTTLRGMPDVVAAVALARCLQRHRAIKRLVVAGFGDEAAALLRGLGRDTQRLEIIARNPGQRVAFEIRWYEEIIQDLGNLAAKAGGVPGTLASDLREFVRARRADIAKLKTKHGLTGRSPRFPPDGLNAAIAVGQPDDEIDYELSTDASHSGFLAMHRYLRATDATTVEIHVGDISAEYGQAVLDRATRYLSRAIAATAALLDDPGAETYETFAAGVAVKLDETRAAEEAAPPPDRQS